MAILLAIIAALTAEAGGLLALKNRKRLNLTLGFTAGVLIGLVAFDLLPEIFNGINRTGLDPIWPMLALVIGFLTFHIIEKAILIHHSSEEGYTTHQHPHVGVVSAMALIGHSLIDGLSIGLAYQINKTVGFTVAVAVIGHRFVDGFNGVNIMLVNKNALEQTKKVLYFVAVAPIIGVLLASFINPPENFLTIYLAFFAGFLLYIGSADILPQAHSKGSDRRTIIYTVVGAACMLFVTLLVQT